jgi:ribosomal protein L37AE/L43A
MRRVFGFFIYHPEKTCPRCGSMHVHRTKRGRILEYWVLFFIAVRPYRCGKCRLRFYGPKKYSDVSVPDAMTVDGTAPSTNHHSESSRPSQR